jgi:hypothetical protein
MSLQYNRNEASVQIAVTVSSTVGLLSPDFGRISSVLFVQNIIKIV